MKSDSVKSKSGHDLRAQYEARMAERVDPKMSAARTRAETIRNGVRGWVKMRAAIVEAFALDDWVTLGYSSWQAYLDTEFSLSQLRLTGDELRESAAEFQAAGMNLREIGAATGTSKDTASRALKPALVSRETKSPLVEAVREAIEDAEISADSFRCEKCNRLLAEGIVTAAQRRCLNCDVNREHFAAERGGPCLACSAVTPTDSPATDPIPNPPVEPTPMAEPQQPGHDSPTGLMRADRSETSHHLVGGHGGEAPETPPVSVEPVELEDGDLAAVTSPSSSDPLLAAFAALVLHIGAVDVATVGPLLFDEEVQLLVQHATDIDEFVERLIKARTP